MRMMDCQRIDELLSPFVDGELPLDLSRSVLCHLQSCAHCRAEVDALRSLSGVVQDLRETAPVGMAASILSQARASHSGAGSSSEAKTSLGRVLSFWPRAAAMLVGAASVSFIMSRLIAGSAGLNSVEDGLRSPFQLLVAESQAGIELGGSFREDCQALAAIPEGRLIHELTGGR